jgi:hypothetical protein
MYCTLIVSFNAMEFWRPKKASSVVNYFLKKQKNFISCNFYVMIFPRVPTLLFFTVETAISIVSKTIVNGIILPANVLIQIVKIWEEIKQVNQLANPSVA